LVLFFKSFSKIVATPPQNPVLFFSSLIVLAHLIFIS
jgi:hypothetical protein